MAVQSARRENSGVLVEAVNYVQARKIDLGKTIISRENDLGKDLKMELLIWSFS